MSHNQLDAAVEREPVNATVGNKPVELRDEQVERNGLATPENDFVWGAKAIADEINRTVRQTYYLIEKKGLPVHRIESGGTKAMLVASRRRLRAWLVGAK
jgi:hypothetical protein